MRQTLIAVFCATTLAVGCADLSSYTRQSNELVTSQLPQIDGMMTSAQSLKDRAMKLPSTVPGATEFQTKISESLQGMEKMKSDFSAYPAKIDEAAKAGDADRVTRLMDEQKSTSTSGLSTAGMTLDSMKTQLASLEATAAKTAEQANATANADMPTPSMFSKVLPTGYSLSGNSTGIETQLVSFVEDSNRPVDKSTWFNFDRLTFKTGSAELDMDKSKEQINNIAEILKAYPSLKLKVGGYTDNQGKSASNKKLSAARATTVVKTIAAMGVSATRMNPEGFGADHPVCAANDTEECRAQNRRIAVRVMSK